MREIVVDTETTGLNPLDGDRIVEVAGIELFNLVPTGKYYHSYFNPERKMPEDTARIHGLTDEFLADKPIFASCVGEFLEFISDAKLVMHNAEFDLSFLNAELQILGLPAIPRERTVDTLAMARKTFPGLSNSLDALCKRFGIDLTGREQHGALLDAKLLAEVYLELMGGRQPGLVIDQEKSNLFAEKENKTLRQYRIPRTHSATEEELLAHSDLIKAINNPLWSRIDRSQ